MNAPHEAGSGQTIVHVPDTPYATEMPNVVLTPIARDNTPVRRPILRSSSDGVGVGAAAAAAEAEAEAEAGAGAGAGIDETQEDGVSSTHTDICPTDGPRLYAFNEVREQIKKNFHTKQMSNSFVCDMIALYLKGQKILYTEAKTYCELRLTYLMLPAILITASCSVLSPILKDFDGGSTLVSALNGFTAFLLAVINYLKLDAKAEAHRTAAYKFDKLQAALVFKSGRNLFMGSTIEDLNAIIVETEKSVRDIKETDSFVLPEGVRYNFPVLYGINIFAEIKKVQNHEMILIHELWSMYNETATLEYEIKQFDAESQEKVEKSKRLKDLDELHKKTLNNIINIKDQYQLIDDEFERELKRNRTRWTRVFFCCCGILKT